MAHTDTILTIYYRLFNDNLLLQIVFSRIKKKLNLVMITQKKKLEQHTFNRNILIIEVVYFLGRTVFFS